MKADPERRDTSEHYRRTFSDMVKGGRMPIAMEDENNGAVKNDEAMANNEADKEPVGVHKEAEKSGERSQKPSIMVEKVEERIRNIVGRILRVDSNTADKCRRKFAHLCVELNLQEPLISQYSINGTKYLVEYEGIHSVFLSVVWLDMKGQTARS
ncbi:hypothetical protein Ahy_B05g077996 [Arachis hypogaea]|uniref:Uncharacterized protein n=1 Tax=Arachis hypogaea TaxID=3818 RepID=A0A444Z618_ARAHY|nr:hypothetical protein Ahy_B05g077996 [Arachis hypogaea]